MVLFCQEFMMKLSQLLPAVLFVATANAQAAFLVIPMPEPTVAAELAVAALGVGLLAWRFRRSR